MILPRSLPGVFGDYFKFQGDITHFIQFVSGCTRLCGFNDCRASSSLHDGMAQQIQPATSKTDTFLHKLHILILILIFS